MIIILMYQIPDQALVDAATNPQAIPDAMLAEKGLKGRWTLKNGAFDLVMHKLDNLLKKYKQALPE
jgi:hypothetical protein